MNDNPVPRKPLDSPSFSAEKVESECDIEFYRGSGPGGQNRNKVETCVRLRHRPSGIVVNACEERSQARNRAIALEKLIEALRRLSRRRKPRRPTRKSVSVRSRELSGKKRHGVKKKSRGVVRNEDPAE